jgi:hypothetical protein
MPAPIPDLSRDQQCHHYQAPTGQRCGSPAMKGEYYCYHHLVKTNYKKNHRVLIDPEVTCMDLPVIEDRASIFVALAAVIHRLAENTIDTRRAGQMIYGLQVAMRALEPPPAQRSRTAPAAQMKPAADSSSATGSVPQPATDNLQPATPPTIPITKESLLYFLRSRHCYNCNTELFPPEELTYRRNPGAPPEIIEEANPRLPAPQPATDNLQPATVLPTLNAVASDPVSNLEPGTSNLAGDPLPLSTVLLDNVVGCAWPDRTSFRKKIQDGQQGPKALCRGVSGGWADLSSLPKQAACQPRWLANSEVRRINQCAKLSPCNAPPARTGTTPPRRTRRRPPAASSSQSSATPAASTRHTKRRSKSSP